MKRIDRLRKRMDDATDWAALAKHDGSWVAAATLLKAAEVFDEKLAALELAAVEKASDDPLAVLAEVSDIINSLPPAAREQILAHLSGQVH
jgi:hypothetical protein